MGDLEDLAHGENRPDEMTLSVMEKKAHQPDHSSPSGSYLSCRDPVHEQSAIGVCDQRNQAVIINDI